MTVPMLGPYGPQRVDLIMQVMPVRPCTKRFPDFDLIWCVGRPRPHMHIRVTSTRSKVKVKVTEVGSLEFNVPFYTNMAISEMKGQGWRVIL